MSRSWCAAAAAALGVMLGGKSALARADSADEATLAALENMRVAQQERLRTLEAQAAQEEPERLRAAALRAQIRELLADAEFREELAQTTTLAGYDDGFFLKSSDDAYTLNLNGFMQFRWTHAGVQARNRYLDRQRERDDRTGFDIQRIRIIASGNVGSENLTYEFDVLADSPEQYNAGLLWAYFNYRFADEFQVTAGRFNIPGTRANYGDERGYQLIEMPLADAVFNIGDGTGVMIWGDVAAARISYYASIVNGLNGPDNRVITSDDQRELDGNPAFVGRLVWHALGDDPDAGQYEGDTHFLESPALNIGAHYAFNEDDGDADTTLIPYPWVAPRGGGGFALTNSNGLRVQQAGVDATFKFMGFSLAAEYEVRFLDVTRSNDLPLAPLYRLTGDKSTNAQHGAYLQAGYFLPIPGFEKKVEIAGRVGGISALAGMHEAAWEYAGGVNWYLHGHHLKVQTDVTRIQEAPISNEYLGLGNVNDGALIWRVQMQVAF